MWNNQEDNRNTHEVHPLSWIERVFKARAESINVTPRTGFKESLFLRLSTARQTKRMSPSFSGRPFFAGAGLVAFVAAVVLAIVFQPFVGVSPVYAQDQFTLVSEAEDPLGTKADATYLLKSKTPIDVRDVETMLSASTHVPFTLEQIDNSSVRVAFEEPLREGAVVAFALETTINTPNGETPRRYGWAFQVKAPLAISSTLPGDRSSGVPLDTGVEVSFNHELSGVEEFERAFSIEPAVSGRFEVSPTNNKTFVFIPDAPLAKGEVYTVTLAGSLSAKEGGDTLGKDVTFQFETSVEGASGEVNFWIPERYTTAIPGEEFALNYYDYDWRGVFANEPYSVALYRIPNQAATIDVLNNAMRADWRADGTLASIVDPASLALVSSFEAITRERSGAKQVVFPAPLEEGGYVAEISHAGYTRWVFIQSTPLVTYLAVDEKETLVWVNSTETNAAVDSAKVSYLGRSERAQTNTDGLARITTPVVEEETIDTTIIMEVTHGSHALLIPSSVSYAGPLYVSGDALTRRGPGGRAAENYVGYLYTDRPTYQTTDTVQVWGVLKHRANGSVPSEVTLGFSNYGAEPLLAERVSVSPTGVFTAEFDLGRMSPGYYEIIAEVEGETVLRRGITTDEYVKPAYTLSLSLDRDAVFVGETVSYTVTGAYFEGTPAKGLQVRVSPEYGESDQELTLDDAGMASGSFVVQYESGEYYPRSIYPTVSPVRTEEGEIQGSASLSVFGPNVWIGAEEETAKIENGVGSVKIEARNVEAIASYDPKVFAPTLRAGQALDVTVTEVSYTAREVGTRYDHIRKVTTPLYEYDQVERVISTTTVSTDGSGSALVTFPADRSDVNYVVGATTLAPNGYVHTTSAYVWQRDEWDEVRQSIEFDPVKEGVDDWRPTYREGEQVELRLKEGRKEFVMPEGVRALYFQAQNGIREEQVSNEARYVFPFEARDIPNVFVYGVLFVGDGYVFIGSNYSFGESGYGVGYDFEENRLNVSVTPSVEATRPGETVSFRVSVTDASGKPVEADVNLNIVDEAYYALYPESVDPLPVLYQWLSSGVQAVLVSREASDATAMAEGGGGGGDGGGRTNFKDTAAFVSVRTDARGEAEVSALLPDDITEWRITAQAIDLSALAAGHAKTSIDASLPLFGLFVMRPAYLASDEPTILLRAAGTSVRPSDTVTYTVSVPSVSFETTAQARAGESLYLSLPDLPLGTHRVTVQLEANGEKDVLTRSVSILSTRSTTPVYKTIPLNDGSILEGAEKGLTDVAFFDADRAELYYTLQRLAWTYGDRADEGAVSLAATRLLNEAFDLDLNEPGFNAAGYQSNGITLLPYASEDLSLSSRLAMVGGVGFGKGALTSYFYQALEKTGEGSLTRTEKFEAMVGLAALKEPILLDLERAMEEKDLTVDEQLLLALGFHLLGDDESARGIYRALVKTLSTSAGYAFLDGSSMDERTLRTARLAALSSALNEAEHEELFRYVIGANPQGILTLPEQFLYAKSRMPYLGKTPVSFRLTVNGEPIEKTLEPWETYSLTLTEEARRALNIQVTEGELAAVVAYENPTPEEREANDPTLGLTRSFIQADGSTRPFVSGDEVDVLLSFVVPPDDCLNNRFEQDPNAHVPCQGYMITDVLPAGLVPVTPTQMYLNRWGGKHDECTAYSWGSWEGRSTFYVQGNLPSRCNNTIRYRARVVTPGTYTAESATIRPTVNLSSVSYSDEQTFVANP